MSAAEPIRLVLSDVDGTLINSRRELTPATVDAVGRLRDAGVIFAVTSGRPPRGLSMLIDPLRIDTPLAAFNGGEFVSPAMEEQRTLDVPADLVEPIISTMRSHGLFAWLYSGAEWYVTDPSGTHVAQEAATVEFQPTVVDTLAGVGPVAKIVGASDDHEAVARAAEATRAEFGHSVSAARSQPYYLDVTHPNANKGAVVTHLGREFDIPLESVATLGDMPNDVLMFAHCGTSIAMGNASLEVQRSARHVTDSNDEDGFARAIDRFVLSGS
ncbi:MAG: HAD family phosphatase [Microthrixaceae bacterium]|nr:HAD family phosphatase [Microthrixaceae bacterium]MCB1011708.1 HAD family phosphatase [Microthrixaceae bacterium]